MRRTFLSLLLLGALPGVALAQAGGNKSKPGHGAASGANQSEKQDKGNKTGNQQGNNKQ